MQNRWRKQTIFILIILYGCLLVPFPLQASPVTQADDPVAQCATGVELFNEGDYDAAAPFLEAGFSSRYSANFSDPNRLGHCALALGMVRNRSGDPSGALKAYEEALVIFSEEGDLLYQGLTLQDMGAVHESLEQYEDALNRYREALSIYRRISDRTHEGVVLTRIAWVYNRQRQDEMALIYFEEALVVQKEIGNKEGEVQILNYLAAIYQTENRHEESAAKWMEMATLHLELGNMLEARFAFLNAIDEYSSLGQFDEALNAYEEALAITLQMDDLTGEGVVLTILGNIYQDQGRYEEARTAFDTALTILEEALALHREAGNQEEVIDSLKNIAEIHQDQGRFEEAIAILEEVLAIFRERNDRINEGLTLQSIAAVYSSQGRYAEALFVYRQALTIHRETANKEAEGSALNRMAGIYVSQAQYEEALPILDNVLNIRRELEDINGEAAALNTIADIYYAEGRYEEALSTYEEASALYQWYRAPFNQAHVLNNIGLVYVSQGRWDEVQGEYDNAQRNYERALENFEEALSIFQQFHMRLAEGVALSNIGDVFISQQEYERALVTLEDALSIHQEVGDPSGAVATLSRIAQVYQFQGQYAEALQHYQEALDILETLRAGAGHDSARATFISQYSSLYDRSLELFVQEGLASEAFLISELGRARSFADTLATEIVQFSDEESASLITAESAAYNTLIASQTALYRAHSLSPNDPELSSDLESRLAEAQEAHKAALNAITAHSDQLAALVPARRVILSLPDVQKLLDEQTTLISYWVLGEKGTIAFVVTHDNLAVVELPQATSDNLLATITNLYGWLNPENPHPRPLRDLYTWLAAPLEAYLNTPLVGIIPHQVLHYVPFTALTDGETYLGQQHTLFSLPSAGVLRFIQENAANLQAPTQPPFIIGNPETNGRLPTLLHATNEATSIASLLDASAYTGAEASETQLRDNISGASVVHLAAHGEYNVFNQYYSAIHLAQPLSSQDEALLENEDGHLEVHEIYGLDLRSAELVVLSACQTNIGEITQANRVISAGDEIVGLTRAFFFAGTPTVISSLWNVDDAATEQLMVAFYENWQTGMDSAEALQAAQAELRQIDNGKYASPFYWAGFVLSGEPGHVTEYQPSSPEPKSTLIATAVPELISSTLEPDTNSRSTAVFGIAMIVFLSLISLWGLKRFRNRKKKGCG